MPVGRCADCWFSLRTCPDPDSPVAGTEEKPHTTKPTAAESGTDEKPHTDKQAAAGTDSEEDFPFLIRFALFGIVVAVLAVWFRFFRGDQKRDNIGYEKTRA